MSDAPKWDSALTAAERDACLADHPVWYIAVARKHVPEISLMGLMPTHDSRHLRGPSPSAPQAWTYLATRHSVDYLCEAIGLADDDMALLAVNLDTMDPCRIRPDELEWDAITGPTFAPADYGIPEPRPHQHPAEWAAEVRLGSQPQVSALALDDGHIAVRGHVLPQRVTVLERLLTPTELEQWEREHLAARSR